MPVKRSNLTRQLALAAVVCLVLIAGCPEATDLPPVSASRRFVGMDSAGAQIEIGEMSQDVVHVRIEDPVLGFAEATAERTAEYLTFTVTFPVGAVITYTGTLESDGISDAPVVEGVWVQHAGGIFGHDEGTWRVRADSPSR